MNVAVYPLPTSGGKGRQSFFVHHGKPYEKTHDIEVLFDLAGEIDSRLSKLADAADALTLTPRGFDIQRHLRH